MREAMILAAGEGTRLRPLTRRIPKALVDVGGQSLLDRVARRLVAAGVERLVVNASPHAEMIREHIRERDGFGVEVAVSEEPEGPLGTGGGLQRAARLFRGDGPLLVHNVDILTDLDLRALLAAQADADPPPLATLAVCTAETERYLLVDDRGLLGYRAAGEDHTGRPASGDVRRVDFCGVQAISRSLPGRLTEEGKFGIMTSFLRLVREGERIAMFEMGDASWVDVGTHERLALARVGAAGPDLGLRASETDRGDPSAPIPPGERSDPTDATGTADSIP